MNTGPQITSISKITSDMEGRQVSTTGYLVQKTLSKDGHLFLTISDNKTKIEVPVFSDLVKNLQKNGVTPNDFHKNSRISVEGTLEIYKGNLQIVPKKASDIKILGD